MEVPSANPSTLPEVRWSFSAGKVGTDAWSVVHCNAREAMSELSRAQVVLLMESGGGGLDDLLETGVEIVAQPPGKKLGNIELMSGGEKALTAVSLIFAIFQHKPSPFCILDEVDAPLDEANVARYNDLVRGMTDRSQFILITHNKRTMEVADTLYGVTMEEPGVSKLVSVKLKTAVAANNDSQVA